MNNKKRMPKRCRRKVSGDAQLTVRYAPAPILGIYQKNKN